MIDKRDRRGLHMPTETTAQVEQLPIAPDEGDYQAFCEALSTSARGRAFLAAHARLNRNADTEQLLAAIGRLQSLMATPAAPQTSDTIKQQLRALHDDIVTAQCELDARILALKACGARGIGRTAHREHARGAGPGGSPGDRGPASAT
jgi:hypothetical protein